MVGSASGPRDTAKDKGLTDAEVSVDARVPRRARQVLVLAVRNVQVRLGVSVLLRESKVDHVDLRAKSQACAHEHLDQSRRTWFPRLPMPMRKLSGLMSRWIKLRE